MQIVRGIRQSSNEIISSFDMFKETRVMRLDCDCRCDCWSSSDSWSPCSSICGTVCQAHNSCDFCAVNK